MNITTRQHVSMLSAEVAEQLYLLADGEILFVGHCLA